MRYIEIYIQNKKGLLVTATVRINALCDSHCHLKKPCVHGVAYQWINVFMVVFLIVGEIYFNIMVVLFFRSQFPFTRILLFLFSF